MDEHSKSATQAAAGPGEDCAKEWAKDWAKDWVTIWQSELAAMAVDRELLEGIGTGTRIMGTATRMWTAWSKAVQETMDAAPARHPTEARPAHGPAPAAAPPGAGGAEIEQLRARVAELEQRLADADAAHRPAGRRRRRTPA